MTIMDATPLIVVLARALALGVTWPRRRSDRVM